MGGCRSKPKPLPPQQVHPPLPPTPPPPVRYMLSSPPPLPRAPRPSPPAELQKPWRKMQWGDKEKIEQNLKHLKFNHTDVQCVRILLVGDVGAGKSSFINSVNNAFQKRITAEALTNSLGGTSFTKKYETYYIKGEDGSPLSFVFNDVKGLETGEAGAHTQDMIRALHGYLQEGFNFESSSSMSMNAPGYRENPSLKDQTFCLVNIMAANTVSMMKQEVINKMKKIREAATELNMPQVIILTKPDLACPLVEQDLRKIYFSKKIKMKIEECSNLVGVPINHIFPVKNYHHEMDTDEDMDALIFKALDQIVNIAVDALERRSRNLQTDSGDKPV